MVLFIPFDEKKDAFVVGMRVLLSILIALLIHVLAHLEAQ